MCNVHNVDGASLSMHACAGFLLSTHYTITLTCQTQCL